MITLPQGLETMAKLRNMVGNFESNPANRKKYDLVLQDCMRLLANEFKRQPNGTRINAPRNLFKRRLRLK